MRLTLLLLLLTTLLGTGVRAQDVDGKPDSESLPITAWETVDPAKTDGDRRINVARASYFGVDKSALRAVLFAAPHERDVAAKNSVTRLSLPLAEGKTATLASWPTTSANRRG